VLAPHSVLRLGVPEANIPRSYFLVRAFADSYAAASSSDVNGHLQPTVGMPSLHSMARGLTVASRGDAGRSAPYENRRFMAWPAMTAWPCIDGGGMP
jgi:hypothetical protein